MAVMFSKQKFENYKGMSPVDLSKSDRSSARLLAEKARMESCAVVSVYRPFFICGVLTVVTAGCLLGAIALFGISGRGSYLASSWTPYVLAHANSQLYGWVGFFVIGFSLQHHAPSVAKIRQFHTLSWLSLGLISSGIVLRFLAEPFASGGNPFWVFLGVFSASLQSVAVLLFVITIATTRHRPRISMRSSGVLMNATCAQETQTYKKMPWPTAFVLLSLFAFVVSSLIEPVAFALSHQASRKASIMFVAEWMAPIRELQFLGFVASMIFGVGLAKFSQCMGTPKANPTFGLLGFGFWVSGLVARICGWLRTFQAGMQPGTGDLYFAGGFLLALGVCFVIISSGVFERPVARLHTHKFLRASFGWLFIAGILMVAEPLVLRQLDVPFSHAFTGAVRHALTVGFISQMIIAFSSTIVPNILSYTQNQLPDLWPTFWLLNLGNALRVACEIATDFNPSAFKLMGVTGFVELVGLVFWGVFILKLLFNGKSKATIHHAK